MTVTGVTIDGATIDLDNVEYVIAIDHGRNDITANPQPSAAELTLFGTSTIPAAISDSLVITAYGTKTRFTGSITDIRITHQAGTFKPSLHITAMGNLMRLGLLQVGDLGYLEESLTDRVEEILDETGMVYTANTDPYMVLLAEDPDQNRSAMDWLTGICTDTGATMCDLPDGNILFESYTRRGVGYNPATFAQVTDPFSDVVYIWSDVYESYTSTLTPIELAADSVVFSPVWSNTVLSVVNQATVTYGNPEAKITSTDAASIATHGVRAYAWTSRLSDMTDAFDRVTHITDTQSEPRYGLTGVQILVDELTTSQRNQVLGLIQGARVLVTNLPSPGPAPTYTGVLEGYSESFTPDGHIITLSLSDPRFSYAMAKWSEVSASLIWSGVAPAIQWYNVVLPSDLVA